MAAGANGFIENRGQIDPAVEYYSQGASASVFFVEDGVVLDLRDPAAQRRAPSKADLLRENADPEATRRACAVWVRFVDANPDARPEPLGDAITHFNFYLGTDGSGWREGVPVWGTVLYRDLWPGIDLLFRFENGALIHEPRLRAGADPARIAFAFDGVERTIGQADGATLLVTEAGAFAWRASGLARIRGDRELGDCLEWATLLGGIGNDVCWGRMALGDDGNPILAGVAMSADFPSTPGTHDDTFNGAQDVVVLKLAGTGDALLWGTFMGGPALDSAWDVILDEAGNPIIGGSAGNVDFPTTPGAYDQTHNGGDADAFVAKFAGATGQLVWSSLLGGSVYEFILDIALNAAGDLTVVGNTNSPDFPVSTGAFDESHNGEFDGFVARLDASGSALLWSTYVGGSGGDEPLSVLIDPDQNAVVSGETWSPNFPTTPGAYDTVMDGVQDSFVFKIDPTGSALVWSSLIGGPAGVVLGAWGYSGYGLALSPTGDVALATWTNDPGYPTTAGAFDETYNGFHEAVLSVLSEDGSALLYSSFFGGNLMDYPTQILYDGDGQLLMSGWMRSVDFPVGDEVCDGVASGADGFILRLSPDLASIEWSTFMGGTAADDVSGFAIVPSGGNDLIISGTTTSADFPATPGAFDETFNGAYDWYAARLSMTQTGIGDWAQPSANRLGQNHPNPFNPSTLIEFELQRGGRMELDVYDIQGRHLRRLLAEERAAGRHIVRWDGRDDNGSALPSGVYFYRLHSAEGSEQRKAVLLK